MTTRIRVIEIETDDPDVIAAALGRVGLAMPPTVETVEPAAALPAPQEAQDAVAEPADESPAEEPEAAPRPSERVKPVRIERDPVKAKKQHRKKPRVPGAAPKQLIHDKCGAHHASRKHKEQCLGVTDHSRPAAQKSAPAPVDEPPPATPPGRDAPMDQKPLPTWIHQPCGLSYASKGHKEQCGIRSKEADTPRPSSATKVELELGKPCPKCGGSVEEDDDGGGEDLVCRNCGLRKVVQADRLAELAPARAPTPPPVHRVTVPAGHTGQGIHRVKFTATDGPYSIGHCDLDGCDFREIAANSQDAKRDLDETCKECNQLGRSEYHLTKCEKGPHLQL